MKSPLSLKGRTAEILNVFKGGYMVIWTRK